MDKHLNLVGIHAEEPLRLYHLKTLVHHRSRVDGYLGSHVPRGVLEGVGSLHVCHLLQRELAEGTSRSREQDFLYLVVTLTHQALEDGRVLAVNGKDVYVILCGKAAYQFASHYERLLVGKTDGLAGADGMDGRRKTGISHHRREHHVHGSGLNYLVQSLRTCIHLNVGHVSEQRLEVLVIVFVGYYHSGWSELACLLGKHLVAVVCREAIHLIKVAMLFNHIQGLCADATGGAKDTYLFLHKYSFYCL